MRLVELDSAGLRADSRRAGAGAKPDGLKTARARVEYRPERV